MLALRGIAFALVLIGLVFLLLSTISAPIVSSFPLGKLDNFVYGVFGYCKGSECMSATYPYTFALTKADWFLSESNRNNLVKALILTPVTLGLSFFTLVAIVFSFFVPVFISIAMILAIVTTLCLIVVAVMAVIIFHPYEGWLAWCLIGSAAVAIIASVLLVASFAIDSREGGDDEDTASLTNFDQINQNFNEKFSNNPKIIGLPHTRNRTGSIDTSSNEGYEAKIVPRLTTSNTLSTPTSKAPLNSSLYTAQALKPNDFTKGPIKPGYYSSSKSSFSNRTEKVSVYNSVGNPVESNKQIAPTVIPNVATRSSTEESFHGRQQAPYPTNSVTYDQSVFQHHPEVEGHKPFTELDDFDIENDEDDQQLQGSDSDSDFTSVSQRAYDSPHPNARQFIPHNQQTNQQPPPQFYNQTPPQPMQPQFANRGYSPQQYQQRPQQFQPRPQQYRPSASENALQNNPDFNLVGATKRKNNNGFVPVAARYKNQVSPVDMRRQNGQR